VRPLLDKRGLAELLGVSVSWVEKATAAREVPITWVGRYARYDQDDIAAWLESRKEPADRPATLSVIGPKRPTPSKPPAKPKPPAGPVKPKPPAGPRRVDTAA